MTEKKEYQVITNENYCKGCSICVEFCPKDVLAIVNELVQVNSPQECIGCKLCEERCPDLAIEVMSNEN